MKSKLKILTTQFCTPSTIIYARLASWVIANICCRIYALPSESLVKSPSFFTWITTVQESPSRHPQFFSLFPDHNPNHSVPLRLFWNSHAILMLCYYRTFHRFLIWSRTPLNYWCSYLEPCGQKSSVFTLISPYASFWALHSFGESCLLPVSALQITDPRLSEAGTSDLEINTHNQNGVWRLP